MIILMTLADLRRLHSESRGFPLNLMCGFRYMRGPRLVRTMGRIGIFWLVVGVMLAAVAGPRFAYAARPEGPEVLDVRVAPHPDGSTHFVLELSDDIPFTVAAIAGGIT